MQRFFTRLAKNRSKVSYGHTQVMRLLKMGAVDTLLVSDACDDAIIEELESAAKEIGSVLRMISTETREGVQLRDLGKIAALLRYEVYE